MARAVCRNDHHNVLKLGHFLGFNLNRYKCLDKLL
jgi:hypothetical protein